MAAYSRRQKISAAVFIWVGLSLIVASIVSTNDDNEAQLLNSLNDGYHLIMHDHFSRPFLYFIVPLLVVAAVVSSVIFYYNEVKKKSRPAILKKTDNAVGMLLLGCIALFFIAGPLVNHPNYVLLKSAGYERCEDPMISFMSRRYKAIWTKEQRWCEHTELRKMFHGTVTQEDVDEANEYIRQVLLAKK